MNNLLLDDDIICLSGLDIYESGLILNDGNDDIFNHVEQPAHNNIHSDIQKKQLKWSYRARERILYIREHYPAAQAFLDDFFYNFEFWPPYMVDLFVLNSIAMYSYSMRNKICLFFFGNGGNYDIFFKLSQYFAIKSSIDSYDKYRDYQRSRRKAEDLFKTYSREINNPDYARQYYFYSIEDKLMMYLDNTPRRNGGR